MERIKDALWDSEKDDFTLAGGFVAGFFGAVLLTWGGIILAPLAMLGII
jgi:hypothetical protein